MDFLYVFLGGGLGSICRFAIGRLIIHEHLKLPFATITANLVACIVLGVVMGMVMRHSLDKRLVLFLAVGFCGGFSTFSTFSLENVQLWQSESYMSVLANIAISVVICFGGVILGMRLAS